MKVLTCDYCNLIVNPLRKPHTEAVIYAADYGEMWKVKTLHFCSFNCHSFWFARNEMSDSFTVREKKND